MSNTQQTTPYVPRTVLVSPIFGTGPRYKAPPKAPETKKSATNESVAFAGVGFIFGAAQAFAAQHAGAQAATVQPASMQTCPPDERVHQLLARLTLREHGFLLAHVHGLSYGAMARAAGIARSTATIDVCRAREKLEEESTASLRVRWASVVESIEDSEYERMYGMPKQWWNLPVAQISGLMGPSPTASNQHMKRYAALRRPMEVRAPEAAHG